MLPLLGQSAYGGIGKLLPTLLLMRARLMGAYGQGSVQQEHTLVCPTGEVTAFGYGNAQVVLNLLEDVLEGRREGHSVVYREAQAVRLSRSVVRVLPDDHHLRLVERTKVEGIENQFAGRIYLCTRIFVPHEVGQLDEVVLLKLRLQLLFPGFFYLYIHNQSFWFVKVSLFADGAKERRQKKRMSFTGILLQVTIYD